MKAWGRATIGTMTKRNIGARTKIKTSSCKDQCIGMASKTHEEIVIKLTRIEAGQQHVCQSLETGQLRITQSLEELNKVLTKISIQEERQIQLKSRLDAAWIKIDSLKEAHDKCPIINIQTQLHWLWVFLSSLALGLIVLSVKVILGLDIK